MKLPPYFLPRPDAPLDPATVAAFEQLWAEQIQHGNGALLDYRLAAPKWQLLCYLCDTKPVVLHGSGTADIAEFEPRQSNDVDEFGNRCAVYAASDGIWPIYFAIMDRDRYVISLVNGCFRIVETSEPYYFFSINADALPHQPWRTGTIYILPRQTFHQQPHAQFRGAEIEIAQWASLVPVQPLARLTVEPHDFPFLRQISAHDPHTLRERATVDPDGFPWLDAGETEQAENTHES